jgi:hypothetical protein
MNWESFGGAQGDVHPETVLVHQVLVTGSVLSIHPFRF